MLKYLKIAVASLSIVLLAIPASVSAAESKLPTKHDPDSTYEIRYDDWELILSGSVLDTGPSDRRPASRALNKQTSSRLKHGNSSASGFEGNRVLFDQFNDEHQESLLAIRKDLEAVSEFTPLEEFNQWEQLAYWYNLHNVAVMYEVSKAYPIKKLKKLQEGKDNVWDAKTMSIAGVQTSIRDIEEHVITNWKNPLVLYGFFMGTIGGPDIRTKAYTGDNVVEELQLNAVRFVNSLRGFRLWSGQGRPSEHYEIGKSLFPNFEEDLLKHLITFSRPDTRADLMKAKSIKLKNYDWGIADLKNGSTYAGSSFNTNPRALAFFVETPAAGNSGLPGGAPPSPTVGLNNFAAGDIALAGSSASLAPQTKALLRAMKIRNERRHRRGEVTVEEFVDEEGGRVKKRDAQKPLKDAEDGEGSEDPVMAE